MVHGAERECSGRVGALDVRSPTVATAPKCSGLQHAAAVKCVEGAVACRVNGVIVLSLVAAVSSRYVVSGQIYSHPGEPMTPSFGRSQYMKLLNCALVLTAVAVLSVPPIIAVEAAETATAMLKDAKGQNVGSVSLIQTPAGVSCFGYRSKMCQRESTPFISTPWANANRPASSWQAVISIRPMRTTG